MNKRILFTLILGAQILILQAQTALNPWQITLGANAVEFYERGGIEYQMGNDGIQFDNKINYSKYLSYLEVSRYLGRGISFQLGGTLNQVDRITSNPSENPDLYLSVDGGLAFSPSLNTGNFNPTLSLGLGYTSINDYDHITTNLGLGLTYMFDQSFGLTLKAKRKTFSRGVNDLIGDEGDSGDYVNQFLFGFSYAFGNGDSDRDGVKDDVDACVNTPGLPELNGCPDDDGDGVRNKEDDCPDVPGLAALAGCPDMDGDTVADKYDSCPETPGIPALDGCPDADEDGVADKDDNCPEEFGPVENNGCPWSDRDGDGVFDKDDNCPDVPGTATNAGCPEYPIEGLDELSVKFGSDSFEIDATIEEQLAEAFRIIEANSTAKIIIQGHADSTGNDQINLPLSELRASQVLGYLIQAGISPDRLSIVGYGSSQPLGDNNTAEGRVQNRRVDFAVE
ncbi:MAG: OmpA family protein [Flavobacteriaceae bacterium]|nr:OmpA family protein [Flavobacteriaceae bacterium]